MIYRNEIINFNDVEVSFENNTVFKGVNLNIKEGSFHYVVGESGAGKTTLLRLLYMANVPFKGNIRIFGKDLRIMGSEEKQRTKQNIGVVFQNFYLLDHLSMLDNVTLPLRIKGENIHSANKKGLEILNWLGLAGYEHHLPHQLSGGQQQRAVVARALISKPKLVIADEPTGNLDDENAVMLMELFEGLNNMGITVLIATHNKDIVAEFPHNQLLLKDKSLTKIETSEDNLIIIDNIHYKAQNSTSKKKQEGIR